MFARVSRFLFSVSMLTIAAGCSTSGGGTSAGTTPGATATAPVVQGACPQVFLRDGTAYHRVYAKGGQDDATKIVYQASLAETTRKCTINQTNLNITVMAQGRLALGPEGKPGRVKLPIRVAVVDNTTTLYSELMQFEVEVPAEGVTQFLFTKDNVAIPGGAGKQSKVFIGFDEGPQATQ
ncbi:hypothetical protein MRS76_05545 [Rhizobiaceae bacterium n13]|uniref:Lipoprotein n=1 Tax=Ferirhizobium litorale TaxID=2927786 RepID=A0AAE3QE79_9HYPH|nr:hypothetical protein [Fererhizobium litorale]MDI7861411.1 hypothetical protein [Fererhizobium litorale]MDI7921558.1 hypothetical protein [Fererhizobium litorale]